MGIPELFESTVATYTRTIVTFGVPEIRPLSSVGMDSLDL